MRITVFLWREGKWYIALEPISGVVSQGRSIGEALGNLREALELYLEEEDSEIYQLGDARIASLEIPMRENKQS